jgi:arylsulfatase A-like enzyme
VDREHRVVALALLLLALCAVPLRFAFAGVGGGQGDDAASREEAPPDPRPNLLLVTLDTLRADRIAPWGAGGVAPTLDALAAESLIATRAYAPAPLTFPSHTSMLTGLYPFAHGVRDNDLYRLDARAPSVAKALKAAGWRTEAIVAASVLRSGTGLDQGFERYSDVEFKRARNLAVESERPAEQVTDEALARLAVPDARPWFFWLHYFDAHAPFRAPGGPPPTAPLAEQYDAEVRHLDTQFARVLAALRASGALARTWIVVCADHGEGLGLQQETAHAYLCEEGTLRIPLFVRRPDAGVRGAVESLTSAVDVAPTLLAAAGLGVDASAIHGRDLLETFVAEQAAASGGDAPNATAAAASERAIWFETWAGWHQFKWARLEGVVAGGFKYVTNVAEELFLLSEEPLERVNRAAERPEVVRAMRQRFDALVTAPVARFDSAAESLPLEEVARLRELGYLARMVGDDAAAADSDLDPRVHYRSCLELQFALEASQTGDFDASIRTLESLVGRYPKNPLFGEFLGKVLLKAGRKEPAAKAFAAALAVDPELVSSAFYLGSLLRESGRIGEARQLLEKAVALSPVHLEAWLQLRAVHERERRFDLVLYDTCEVIRLAVELRDADGDELAEDSLKTWLPNVLARKLAGTPGFAELKQEAHRRLGGGDQPALARARAILDAAR